MRTALVVGATGLIGKHCLYRLLEQNEYGKVTALVRKELVIKHHKLKQVVINFDELDRYEHEITADDIFCCLGTTIRVARTKENFRKVDFYYPVKLAEIALRNGVRQYLLVSALGADQQSSIFYNQVKGEVEGAIKQFPFESVHIFRPSMLLGDRKEFRLGEFIGKGLMKVLGFLFIGPLAKYKAIDSKAVATAMIRCALRNDPGIHIHESNEIHRIGS